MMESLFEGFSGVMLDVFFALLPILIVFLVFQIFMLKLHRRQLKKILILLHK